MKNKTTEKRHHNLPFFVPHAGCPCLCVYCSQGKITGKGNAERDLGDELCELKELLDAADPDADNQLAFFGGSFTAIDGFRRRALLETANKYIKNGVISSIRISTRPDCIDTDILNELAYYGVKSIELGVQSINDNVLELSGRGCTSLDCKNGCLAVAQDGRFDLGGQMMIGLPGSNIADEIATAKAIAEFGAVEARIYPTAVFCDTPLYDMTLDGRYIPLTLDDAVERAASCAEVFIDAKIKLLRTGLHSSPELNQAPFGANHPAIGELVMGRVYQKRIERILDGVDCQDKNIIVVIPYGDISKLKGHGGMPIAYLKNKYHLSDIEVIQGDMPYMTPRVEVKE